MASEGAIRLVLDLITRAAPSTLESMSAPARSHTQSIRHVIGDENVVGVGISEKVTRKKKTGKLALTFYVQKKIARKNLSAEQCVPPTVPEPLSGETAIPTDVVALGKIVPEAKIMRNPTQPGFSIAHAEGTAGTLGAIVIKGKTLYLLSNSHVLALSGKASKGDSIVYPGPSDGGSMPDDLVAHLTDFEAFVIGGDYVNRVDCAIARPTAARVVDVVAMIEGIGMPAGTIKARRGMQVMKVGRTTERTTGEVRDVNFRFTLNYPGVGDVGFIDQVLCTRYTKRGDSGSLVLDQKSGKAVGLHFAGASGGSVFNPIGEVLKSLGVKLVTIALPPSPAESMRKKIAMPARKVRRRKTTPRKKAAAAKRKK